MTPNDVLAMYENIAGLTNAMVVAARTHDWDGLSSLEKLCSQESQSVQAGALPPLSAAARKRKIDLLKQILANDRTIRDMTVGPVMLVPSAVQGLPN
ncbi:MAG: fliT flagellar protein [Pseudomonadota bacterium]|jgi:flagellar protein FliT